MDRPGEDWHAGTGPELSHQSSGFKSWFGKPYFVKLLFWKCYEIVMKVLIFGCFQPTKMATACAAISASSPILFAALWDVDNSISVSGGCEAAMLSG